MPEKDEFHYPPGAEPEIPEEGTQTDAPVPPTPPAETPQKPDAEPEQEKPEGKKPEDEQTPEGEDPDGESAKPNIKRSTQEFIKDLKKEKKATAEELEQVRSENAELKALLEAKSAATTSKESDEADADIKAFAEKEGLSADTVKSLASILLARVPKVEIPQGTLTPDEAAAWRQERAAAARKAEDDAIRAEAPQIKDRLGVHDDAELAKIVNEVVRLAHLPEFHDKPVDYIVWKHQATLSKMVSPKRPSFEEGNQTPAPDAVAEVDWSQGNKMTPEQVQKAQYS